MYFAVRDGKFWCGYAWGTNPRRYSSPASCVRSLQEAGEDIDDCNVIEDIYEHSHGHTTSQHHSFV